MIRLIINGFSADVPRGTKLQFKRTNNMWNFGSLELSRSTNFTLPSTESNDKIFSVANDVHVYGDSARRLIDAHLYLDSVSIDGKLYISKCDRTSFDCCFLFGELSALKAMSDSKDVANTFDASDIDPVRLNDVKRADEVGGDIWDVIRYDNGTAYTYLAPSVRLDMLFDYSRNGFNVDLFFDPRLTEGGGYLYAILTTSKVGSVTNGEIIYSTSRRLTMHNFDNIVNVEDFVYGYFDVDRYVNYNEQVFTLKEDTTLTLPSAIDSDLFLVAVQYQDDNVTFCGGWSFDTSKKMTQSEDQNRATEGAALGGRTIELKAKDYNDRVIKYAFVRKSEYHNLQLGTTYVHGFANGFACPLVINNVQMQTSATDAELGSDTQIYLADNLPKISYIDIINYYRYAYCAWIDWDDDLKAVTFRPYDDADFDTIEIYDIISVDSIERRFSDFSANNIVKFKSEGYVTDTLTQNYSLNNDAITGEKTIAELNASEGNAKGNNVYVLDVGDDHKLNSSQVTLAWGGISGAVNLQRVNALGRFQKNVMLQRLCDASTQVVVTCLMSEFEYFAMKQTSYLLIDGTKYVWLSANLSNGRCSLTCQKIN